MSSGILWAAQVYLLIGIVQLVIGCVIGLQQGLSIEESIYREGRRCGGATEGSTLLYAGLLALIAWPYGLIHGGFRQ